MFNSVVFDVVISLVFIYLLYSLLITTIQEIIATRFGFRSKILQRAIFRMLEDENKFTNRFKSVLYLFKKSGNGGEKNSISYEFYKHPLILFLGEGDNHSKPAYIKKSTFSKIIIDLLRGDNIKPGDDIKTLIQNSLDAKSTNWGKSKISDQTLVYLKSIWADADGDISKFKKHLENWFDETMDRASDWYKNHTQFILFFVGLTVAIIFNVDTIKIVDKLEKDPKLREQLVQQADAFTKSHPDLDREITTQKNQINILTAQIAKGNLTESGIDSLENMKHNAALNLEQYKSLKATSDTLLSRATWLIKNDINDVHHSLGLEWETYECKSCMFICLSKSLFGWIITALALSLGAPFWFDLLNKLMKLRAAVATANPDENEKKLG
jgi:hypothetical protein